MRRPLLGACLLFILCIIVFYLCVPPTLPDYTELDGEEVYVRGTVTSISTQEYFGEIHTVYTLDGVELHKSMAEAGNTSYTNDQIYCYTKEPFQKTYIGSHITVKGAFSAFEKAENPGEFNSQLYYHILGAGGSLKDAQLISTDGAVRYLQQTLHQIHIFFIQKTENSFSEPYAGIVQAILLGYKSNLDGEIKQLYKEGGMLHIMTISGMHISMLGMGCVRFLRKIRVPGKVSAVVGIAVVILYGMMIGMQASTFRAVCMFSLQMLAKVRGRTYDSFTALGVSATLLLLGQPMYIFSNGFWLSYGCVLGIILATPILSSVCKVKSKIVKGIVSKLMASFGILLVTLPIQLLFFYEYSLYSVIVNFIVLPFLPFVVSLGAITLAIPKMLAGVQGVSATACEMILWAYEWICENFRKLPYHSLVFGAPSWWQMVFYYVCLVLFLLALKYKGGSKMPVKRLRLIGTVMFLCSGALLLLRQTEGLTCRFLSVGQGDCAIVQCEGKNYLIDCGSSSKKSVAEDILLPCLKYYGISNVEGVFVSHADEDHINGITQWLENYEHSHVQMESLILPDLGASALQQEFGELLALAKQQNIAIFTLSEGDKMSLGKLQIEVLNPAVIAREEMLEQTGNIDSNELSQVLLLEYKGHRVLMMGDVGADTEERILEHLSTKDITVLKVAHHGSKYSSSSKFLEITSPQIAIISAGKDNSYGHPHKEVLERLQGIESNILETAKSGCITTVITPDTLKIKQFHNKLVDN